MYALSSSVSPRTSSCMKAFGATTFRPWPATNVPTFKAVTSSDRTSNAVIAKAAAAPANAGHSYLSEDRRGVSSKARKCGIQFGGSQENAGFRRNRTGGQIEAKMVSEEEIDVIENTGFGHWACTANAFFSRLEDDLDRAAELIPSFPESSCRLRYPSLYDRHGRRSAYGPDLYAFVERTVTGFVSFIGVNAVHVRNELPKQGRGGRFRKWQQHRCSPAWIR